MPGIDIFAILSLILALVSIRVLITTIRDRKKLFDHTFTAQDRQRVSEVAFFLLLPISVLLHEAGHALVVRASGGTITGFGYFLYYGYVAHAGRYTPEQLYWIALSGNLVSIILGILAIIAPLVHRMSAPVTYLLFVFGAIDLANSLLFYPLLDFFGNLEGDWSQIYSPQTPMLRTVTGAIHIAVLVAAIAIWRSDRGRQIYAQRVGRSPGTMRRITRTQAANELLEVGERMPSTWRHPLRVISDMADGATNITLQWISGGYGRAVVVYAVVDGQRHIELHGGIRALENSADGFQRPIGLIEGMPPPEQLESILKDALDLVESWETKPAASS